MLFLTLKKCDSVISELNLSSNMLDDDSMISLSEYLQNNEHLVMLDLRSNLISTIGLMSLCGSLIGNISLRQLLLDKNIRITNISTQHLIEAIKSSSITHVGVKDTFISKNGEMEIFQTCSIPIEQREIPIKSNTKFYKFLYPYSIPTHSRCK